MVGDLHNAKVLARMAGVTQEDVVVPINYANSESTLIRVAAWNGHADVVAWLVQNFHLGPTSCIMAWKMRWRAALLNWLTGSSIR
jgi:hypothetical protein